MFVFNAREIAAQEAGFLFDISLREALFQPVSPNRCADLHSGASSCLLHDRGKHPRGGNQMDVDLTVNMHD
jgi:hypothetical protein